MFAEISKYPELRQKTGKLCKRRKRIDFGSLHWQRQKSFPAHIRLNLDSSAMSKVAVNTEAAGVGGHQ